MIKQFYSSLFVLLLAVGPLWGQQSVPSLTLSPSDGLSSSLTFDLKKDHEGYLWISNRMGVDRYDGYAFKAYHLSERDDDVLLLDDGKHHHLTNDSQGRLICYTDRGKIFRYMPETDSFELLYCATQFLGRHSLHAAAIAGDTLLLGLHNGLYRVNLKSRQLESHICQTHNIRTIEPYVGGTYLVGSDHGVGCLDMALDSCFNLGLPTLDVKSIYFDADQQRLWVGTNGSGLWTMHFDGSGAQQIANWESSIVTQIRPYGDSQLVVGTDGEGLLLTSRRIASPLQPLADVNAQAPYLLPSAGVQGLLVDGSDIWLTGFESGVSLLHPASAIRCLELPASEGVLEHRVNDVSVDNHGKIWAAYRQTIAQFDPETGCMQTYAFPKSNFLTIQTASDGTVWAGGYNAGIYHLDPKTGRSSHLGALDGRAVNSNVYSLFEDHQHRMWVGSQFSPLTCIVPNAQLAPYQIPPISQMLQFDVTRVNDIGQLDDSHMAVATTDGIVVLDVTTGQMQSLLTEVDTTWQGTNFIACLDTDHAGNIFVGTDGSGLVIYNATTGQKEQYTSTTGLPSNFIRSIECVGDSLLWVSTENSGIFAFNLRSRSVETTVTHSRGLSVEGFVQEASAQLPDGRLVFGGKGGTAVIDPKGLKINNNELLFVVSEVGLGEEKRLSYLTHPEVLDAPLSQLKHIVLPYGERSLRITFSAVDLYHNSDFWFVYRIGDEEGYWQPLDEHRTATIYTLPAGKHIMTVRCMRGDETVAERVIEIEVEQTPWLSVYALLIYALVAVVLVVSVLVTIIKALQHASSEEKIRFFNSVAHDIRTPLSLVSTPLSDLEPYISPQAPPTLLPLIKRNIKHLNDVVNQLSLFNTGQNRHQTLIPVQLCDFVMALRESYQPLASHHNLSFDIELPADAVWVYADVGILQRVIDNLLGNAFKFTKEGGVRIRVRRQGQRGVVEVSDTGIGMSESTRRRLFRHFFRGENAVNGRIPGFGLGMMYAFQAVKQMHGRLSCQSQEGKGTTFMVQLPVAPAAETQSYLFEEHTEELVASDQKALYSGYRYDILVVEDNEELLSYLKQKLAAQYNVSCASCVADAQLLLKKHYPDLIISDIMMPGMRGDDWCAQLKQEIDTSHIPVILLTANSDYQSEMHGLNMGADDYITKPFDINILLLKIRNIFVARRKMQAHLLGSVEVVGDRSGGVKVTEDRSEEISSLDDQFVRRLFQLMDKYIEQPDLTVEQLASEMAVSHTLFYEKVNKLLGVPPASLIRSCRMKRAKALLLEGSHTVAEVAVMCGFPDAKYFSTAFKKYYGVSPSKITQ